jgi:tetratricopeptide (TPR) repeat protein
MSRLLKKTNGKMPTHGSSDMLRLDKAIAKEDWSTAKRILLAELAGDPNNHWLLTRLSAVLFEAKDYQKALTYVTQAKKIMPQCPLVQWDLAGTLYATGNICGALAIYQALLKKGPRKIAKNPCAEGYPWAMSLIVDCVFRIGLCLEGMGENKAALAFFQKFLELRAIWHGGIYDFQDAAQRIVELSGSSDKLFNQEIKAANDLLPV